MTATQVQGTTSARVIHRTDYLAIAAYTRDGFGEFGPKIAVTEAMIRAYAELTGEIGPKVHDRSYAPQTLILALASGKIRPPTPFMIDGLREIAVERGREDFYDQLPVGASIACKTRIDKVDRHSDGYVVTSTVEVRQILGDGDERLILETIVISTYA